MYQKLDNALFLKVKPSRARAYVESSDGHCALISIRESRPLPSLPSVPSSFLFPHRIIILIRRRRRRHMQIFRGLIAPARKRRRTKEKEAATQRDAGDKFELWWRGGNRGHHRRSKGIPCLTSRTSHDSSLPEFAGFPHCTSSKHRRKSLTEFVLEKFTLCLCLEVV